MATTGPGFAGAPFQMLTPCLGSEWMAVPMPPAMAAAAATPISTKGQRAGARRARVVPRVPAGCRAVRFLVELAMSAIGARQALLLRAAGRRIVEMRPVGVRIVAGGNRTRRLVQHLRIRGRPSADLVALAAVGLHEEALAVVADLIGTLLLHVPVDLGHVLDGDRRLRREADEGHMRQPTGGWVVPHPLVECLGRQVRSCARYAGEQVDEPGSIGVDAHALLLVGALRSVVGEHERAGVVVFPVALGDVEVGPEYPQRRHAEHVRPLRLVIGAAEEGGVDEAGTR